ncbi:MAG: heparan-alpha-glucosaminide N-acetyltransferase domain-containing protein [Imperialibacter sp.]|uniref:acyltransferase family protein n=1 Tax=Imperialibacter sp. TaxID=2038411 RepID=UPI0032F06ADA
MGSNLEALTSKKRLVSLDALRGFTVVAMIIVNVPGSWSHVYSPLLHSPWHGATPTDLVFPFFLFIVGVSVALAFERQLDQGKSKKELVKKVIVRALKIFALGIFLWMFPKFDLSNIRIPGVLQRISIVFLACSLLYLYGDWRAQVKWAVGLLVGYWAIMTFVPVPIDEVIQQALGTGETLRSGGMVPVEGIKRIGEGFIAGNYEPGTNVESWLDRRLVPGRLWEKTWDPEGFLSTFPAIGTGIAGMLAGRLLLSKLDADKKVIWLFFAGFSAFVSGNVFDWFFPINKHIWTSSYVLYAAGLAAMSLAFFVWLVDVQGKVSWTKLGVIFGSNAVVAYVLHGVILKLLALANIPLRSGFFEGLVAVGIPEKLSSLIWALFYSLIICFIPVYFLYKKKIFIKL